MAASIEQVISFDPSRDIDAYLSDNAAPLKRRGLTPVSIELYVMLCRMCEPGQSRLVCGFQSDLAAELRRRAPNVRGMSEGAVCRKLAGLAEIELIKKRGGGPWGDDLVIDIRSPETVAEQPRKARRPRVAVTPDVDRQASLFPQEPTSLRVFSPSEEPDEQGTKSQSIVISEPKSQSIALLEAPKPAEHTSYTRTRVRAHAVDDEVEDEDESTGTKGVLSREVLEMARQPVAEEEAAEAGQALRDIERKWRQVGLEPAGDRDQLAEDRSIIRRSYVLFRRGLIPEEAWAEAVGNPIDRRRQGRRVKKPAAQFTRRMFQVPHFAKLLGAVRERLPRSDPTAAEQSRPMTREEFRAAAPAWTKLPKDDE